MEDIWHDAAAIDELTTVLAQEINEEIDREILLDLRANVVLDAGYFYAPYIPLLTTPVVLSSVGVQQRRRVNRRRVNWELFGF